MTVEIIEFRKLLEAGRRYLEDTATLAELNGRVRAALEAGYFGGGSSATHGRRPKLGTHD
ncbi:hypothetical protein RMI40_30680 [Pseudomonas protegens]|uniref:hypothetical protein n=1 Tax=Pseudomonas protegens TaxID=380021 RepID=UPI001F31B191|nr:hypothetical protein [Pseudomonas protegens]MDS9879204.1 hypothetical protein [Pseudomonas protegens]